MESRTVTNTAISYERLNNARFCGRNDLTTI